MALVLQLEELAWQLKKERLFINSEREQMQKLYEDVKKVAEAVYHVSWIARQQRANLEILIATLHGVAQSECCIKAKQLEAVKFVDSYKQLSYHDTKFADVLKFLRDNPKLVALLISTGEKLGVEAVQKAAGIVLPSLYGNCVMLEDEYLALQLLYTLAEIQVSPGDNPRRLIRKGSCAFSRLFKTFFDSLFSSKLFLTAALHDPVMKLLMEDEWFYDIDPDKAVVRFSPSERLRRFGEQGSNEWKVKLQDYRYFIVDKLVTLSNRFINAIKNNIYCFPVSLTWLVSQIYQLLSKSGNHTANEVRAVCADLVFALFICPAICDPEPYGIMSDVPISHIARHNLMQIAQIIQVLALSQADEIPSKFTDLYDKFEKGCLSGLLDAMLDGAGADPPTVPCNHPQNLERSSILINLSQLNSLVTFLRSIVPHMDKNTDINSLEEMLSILPAIQMPTLTIQPSTPTSVTPSHTPPGTPSSQRSKGHRKKMSLTNSDDVNINALNTDQNDQEDCYDITEDVLVFSFGVTNECPGMLPESKVLSAEQERCRRRVTYQCSPTYEDGVAETHEKRTRFSFPQDQESIGNTSDIQEAISEVASSHSVGSLENDNDNFSDMISANVSGRGTPNVSGRDTPLSQAESVEERRAPDLPETVQKQNREDVTERFGKFEIKTELEKDETKSTVSDTWSTDVLASDSEGPDQNQLERLEEVTEEMVRQNLLGVAEPVSEVSETASDAWSTDVLASDTDEKQAELLQEIDQDDVSSVTDRSVNQDEIDNADTPDRNEVTPLASGRESPVEERELEGLGAVGGMSGHHHHHHHRPRRSYGTDRDYDDDKGEKKKSFFKSFKEKLNKGMKKRGKNDRDDFFPEELGACGDSFDGGGNMMKPPICTETGDDILAKYRKKPSTSSSQSLNMSEESTKEKHHFTKEEENEVPYYDSNNIENCFAFSDSKRKLRLVLSVGDYQNCSVGYHSSCRWIPTSPCDEAVASDGSRCKDNDLVHILRAQLAEAINLRNKEMVAQLHEVIRCIRLFDNDGCMKLFRSLAEEYKGRSHYVAYLTRSKQGLLTSFHYLQGFLQRVQRDKEICNSHMINVCVQRFIESKDRLLSNFMSDFQRLTMSDEKANLVDQFLKNLYHSMEMDPLWQGSSEAQLQDGQISLERYVMGRIYTHAMFPNGDGDIMRDQLIHQHIKKLSQVISPSHKDLCIPKIYQFECPWPAAQREIHMINAYKTPKDKVQCVYRCSLCIMNLLSMANDRKVPAADDFFPVLIYVIIKANPPCLLSTIQYVNSFYGERVAGEEQYWWMQFFSAVKFIKTMD